MASMTNDPEADLAKYGEIQSRPRPPQNRRVVLQEAAARLYAQGLSRHSVGRRLRSYLAPTTKHPDQATYRSKQILKEWERELEFRDMVYEFAVGNVDLQLPAILNGVVGKAKTGRVDAARLMLEVTGRHNPRGDATPTAIQVVVEGVPRPVRAIATMDDGGVVELSGPAAGGDDD